MVRQYLAQHDPDVDAIYRLTDKLPFFFEKKTGPGFSLPVGTFVPYNAQATLHTYQVTGQMTHLSSDDENHSHLR